MLSLIGLWIINLIPGSYEDFTQQEEIQMNPNNIEFRALPLFYFGYLPDSLKDAHSKPTLSSYLNYLPEWKWNGFSNQFHHWLTHESISLRDSNPVRLKIIDALQWSVILMLPAIIIIFFAGMFLTEWSVRTSHQQAVSILIKTLTFFHSIPVFWLASLLLLVFSSAHFLNLFPASIASADYQSPWELWGLKIYYLILPLISITLPALSVVFNLLRQRYLDLMNSYAWQRMIASGVSVIDGLRWEARPHAYLVMLAWMASAIPLLISGSIIIETIFSMPGTGRLLYYSITIRDWPVVHALYMIAATLTIIGFHIADYLQQRYDPRWRTDNSYGS